MARPQLNRAGQHVPPAFEPVNMARPQVDRCFCSFCQQMYECVYGVEPEVTSEPSDEEPQPKKRPKQKPHAPLEPPPAHILGKYVKFEDI